MNDHPDIISCLRETVRKFPGRPAVSDAERTLTYCELLAAARQYAVHLDSDGIVRRMGNLVKAHSTVDFAIAVVGTYLADRVLVPIAKDAPDEFVRRMTEELQAPCASNIAEVLHTTGTTGASKSVLVSHRAVWAAADNNRHFDRITEETVYLIASPLNHVSALRKLEACFLVGAHAVLQDGFVDVKRYYATIAKHRVNALLLPPSAVMFLLLISRNQLQALAHQIRVVHSNGSPMTETTKEELRSCLPHSRLVFAYGATEAGSACCAYDYAESPGKANCVGKVSPHTRISVEDGTVVVAGDTVMEGYLNDSERTVKVLRDGKVHTNDLGRIDADNWVFVLGRKDDVINCGGMKVAPAEVEAVAMQSAMVADCVCFGVDDRLTGSAVKLLVVPQRGTEFDLAELRRFLQKRLEHHQLPTQMTCVAEIPRTPNGKPDRTRLLRNPQIRH